MKKLLLASAMVVFASNAMAGNLYISPKLGYSIIKTDEVKYTTESSYSKLGSDKDNVFHAGFAVGYDMSKFAGVNLRAEAEYMYHAKTDADVGSAKLESKIHSFNANLYYDFKSDSQWTPYIGAGIGLSSINTKFSYYSSRLSDDKVKFTYNFQAGLDYSFDDHNTVGFGLRYSDLGAGEGTGDNGSTVKTKHPAYEATLTYRYTF